MLPLSLLKTAENQPMLIELKNGDTYNGRLVSCNAFMNICLKDVICTSKDGDRFWKMPECYIRGNSIKYMRIPDEIIDLVAEEENSQRQAAFRGSGGRMGRTSGGRFGRGDGSTPYEGRGDGAGRGRGRGDGRGRDFSAGRDSGREGGRGRSSGRGEYRGGGGRGDNNRGGRDNSNFRGGRESSRGGGGPDNSWAGRVKGRM